jgi:hypothetical protein
MLPVNKQSREPPASSSSCEHGARDSGRLGDQKTYAARAQLFEHERQLDDAKAVYGPAWNGRNGIRRPPALGS